MSSRKKRSRVSVLSRKLSGLLNYLGMVTGFTVLLTILLLGYSFWFGKETEAPAETTGRSNPSSGLLSDELSTEAFAREVAVSSAPQLAEYLKTTLVQKTSEAELARIERNRKRLKVADQLLLLDTTPEQYKLAAHSKLMALSALYYISVESNFQPAIKEDLDELRRFAQTFFAERDLDLRKKARLVFLNVELIEAAKRPDSDPAPSVKLIISFLTDFAEQKKEVAAELIDMFPGILKCNRDLGLKIAQQLLSMTMETDHVSSLFRDLYDLAIISSVGLNQKRESAFVGSEDELQELLGILNQLAADPKGGAHLLFEIERVLHWLEQESRFDEAIKIHQVLIDTAKNRSDPEIAALVAQAGRDGIKRSELIGKKLEIRGLKVDGGYLDPDLFKGKFTVVFFLSAERTNPLAVLGDINPQLKKLHDREVQFIAVFFEQKPTPPMDGICQQFPRINFLLSEADSAQTPSIRGQYPAHQIPQAILVNPEGLVTRIALRPIDLGSAVNLELDKFNKR